MSVFLMWLIGFYFLKIFPSIFVYYMNPFDSHLQNWLFLMQKVSLSKVLNWNSNLTFYQMDFWFEFFDIHMNEKKTTYHACHGFKWQNINISSI
jgi:hypothetical protein